MRTYTYLLLLAAITTTFAACGKLDMVTPDTPVPGGPSNPDTGTGNNKIEGTWNFVGVNVISTSTSAMGADKVIMYNNYTTTDNKGVCVIDGANFSITGLSYKIDAMIRTVMWMDGELVTDMDIPFQMTMDPYSAKNPYKLIGADSIYFSKGVMEIPSYGGGVMEVQAAGGKIAWSGDTLVFNMSLNQVVSGSVVVATEKMKFVKKP